MKKKFASFAAAFLLVGAMLCAQSAGQNQKKPVIADQDLVIQIAEITENALFFPVDIDGVRMEVLAVKAPDGTIRTAFNTCRFFRRIKVSQLKPLPLVIYFLYNFLEPFFYRINYFIYIFDFTFFDIIIKI